MEGDSIDYHWRDSSFDYHWRDSENVARYFKRISKYQFAKD